MLLEKYLDLNQEIMKIGDIYEVKTFNGDTITIRVLVFDDTELFYDIKLNDKWIMSNVKTFVFYRLSMSFFNANSKYITSTIILENDLTLFRPDLPMRLLRNQSFEWGEDNFKSDFFENKIVLQLDQIYLIHFGAKGGREKPVLVSSKNKKGFTEEEIYLTAFGLQKAKLLNSYGTGIYRDGCKNGIPSYYIGGFHDLAGNTNG